MTRQHFQKFHCPRCGAHATLETAFSRWLRENPLLDSANGLCIVDEDYFVHRFKTYEGRTFQLMMSVEVKTAGAELSAAQRDTLHAVNQVTRNRRQTPTKERKWQAGTAPMKVWSSMANRVVNLRHFGIHVLRFSGHGPDDSETITWDRREIDTETLTRIIGLEVDPDTLGPIEEILRNHHNKQRSLL